jgi:hypothetical protein
MFFGGGGQREREMLRGLESRRFRDPGWSSGGWQHNPKRYFCDPPPPPIPRTVPLINRRTKINLLDNPYAALGEGPSDDNSEDLHADGEGPTSEEGKSQPLLE